MNLNPIEKLDINSKIKPSFISNFINELQDFFAKVHSKDLLKNLHYMTSLHFTGYDGNFARCINYNEKKIYYIPKNDIIGSKPELGEALKILSPRKILC